MNNFFTNSIQVAGIIDADEAIMLIDCGVKNIGFPLKLDFHQEDISEKNAAAISKEFKHSANFFLITYLQKAIEIIELCNEIDVSVVQIHGKINSSELLKLKQLSPDLKVIKSLIVKHNNLEELKEEVKFSRPYVDAYITDTYDPETGAKGATGKLHDWDISRQLVESVQRPLLLAGGLNPYNVRDAIFHVQPSGVDVHTGIEGKDGRKQKALALEFIKEATAAFKGIRRPSLSASC